LGVLLDSNIAIHMRDGHRELVARLSELDELPFLSILSRIELEGGVVRVPHLVRQRRRRVDSLLAQLSVLPFDAPCADAYLTILAATGWSRPRIFDRMIAATAIVHDLTLVTMNGRDFGDIPGLALTIWPSPKD
jgi:tRNA(fMet)-specific endonuclease VapC